eukprot:CAMPEP_0196219282 /NCGR_PEP_ID=MMETSP0912-20130531/38529_1 /TAXON_ID=49265 /ORGANISM="Thalassiosira rotula, Strain GSO102" /LENGTH=184 /DNA_ID=CAMNT_0041497199 /DNA_START=180 /DNA_END=734 /DNA_ORIENTATION=-
MAKLGMQTSLVTSFCLSSVALLLSSEISSPSASTNLVSKSSQLPAKYTEGLHSKTNGSDSEDGNVGNESGPVGAMCPYLIVRFKASMHEAAPTWIPSSSSSPPPLSFGMLFTKYRRKSATFNPSLPKTITPPLSSPSSSPPNTTSYGLVPLPNKSTYTQLVGSKHECIGLCGQFALVGSCHPGT